MEKLIIIAILMISGDKLLTWAVPNWGSVTETLDVSMIDGSSTCAVGFEVEAPSTQTVTYSTTNSYGFTIAFDNSNYVDRLYCNFTALQELDSSVNNFDVVVRATDSSGTSDKTFTIRLIDRFAPVFAQNPITISAITICNLLDGSVANGQVVYTIDVTDDDPGDAVTLQITTSGTPFDITNGTLVVLTDTDALLQLLNSSNTPNPYTVNIQANDNGNKHQTDCEVQVSYTRGENCDQAGNSNGNGEGDGDGDGFNVLSYNLYVVGFLIVTIRAMHKLE